MQPGSVKRFKGLFQVSSGSRAGLCKVQDWPVLGELSKTKCAPSESDFRVAF